MRWAGGLVGWWAGGLVGWWGVLFDDVCAARPLLYFLRALGYALGLANEGFAFLFWGKDLRTKPPSFFLSFAFRPSFAKQSAFRPAT